MADDNKIEIPITTTYDGSGAKAAAADLGNLTQGTAAAAAGQKNETAATTEAAEATKGLDLKKRELLESMHLVTAQFPLMGEAARTFFNPLTAGIFGIVAAFELWKSRVDEMTQSLGAIQLPDLSDGIRMAEDQATAWSGIAAAVNDADTAFNSVEDTQGRTLKAIAAETDAVKKLIGAQKELAIAKLDQQRQSGQISAAQYDAQKGIIEQGYNDATVQAEINARNADLAQKFNAAQNLDIQSKRYQARADDIAKQYGLGKTDKEDEAQKKAMQDEIDALQKSIDDSRAQLAQLNEATDPTTGEFKADFDWAKLIGHYGAGVTTPSGFAQAYAIEQQNITQNENAQKPIEQQMTEREEAKRRRDAFINKANESAGKAETARDEANEQNDPNIAGSVRWQNAQDRATQKAKDQAISVQTKTAVTEQASDDQRVIEEYDRSKKPSPELTRKAGNALTDLNEIMKDFPDLLEKIAAFAELIPRMQQAQQRLGQVASQAFNAANGPT